MNASCLWCGARSPIKERLEESGSLKLELECGECGGYEMVRLSAAEVEETRRVAVRAERSGEGAA